MYMRQILFPQDHDLLKYLQFPLLDPPLEIGEIRMCYEDFAVSR